MALIDTSRALGWVSGEMREGIWRGDGAVDWDATSADARDAYERTGEGAHLALRNGASPTRLRFRALTVDERAAILRVLSPPARTPGEDDDEYGERVSAAVTRADHLRLLLLAFRVAVEPDDVLAVYDAIRVRRPEFAAPRRVRESVGGLSLLPEWYVAAVLDAHGWAPIMFYGDLIFAASRVSEPEKKASAPG